MDEFTVITCPVGSDSCELFKSIVNRGIDSHLQGFTLSRFELIEDGARLALAFHRDELEILRRRLSEVGTEEADTWGVDLFGDAYFTADES